jgi:hypothetical protein
MKKELRRVHFRLVPWNAKANDADIRFRAYIDRSIGPYFFYTGSTIVEHLEYLYSYFYRHYRSR